MKASGNRKTYCCGKSVDGTLKNVVFVLYVCKCNTKNCTVCCDQRKIYTKCLIKRRNTFFEEHLYKLNQCGNDQDKYDCLQILHA